MNQTKNLIQWKNLTDDEKAGFDFENYDYECQHLYASTEWLEWSIKHHSLQGERAYRLKIEPDKWYWYEHEGDQGAQIGGDIISNLSCHGMELDRYQVIRPAKPDEIPQPERVFKDGAFYPVIHKSDDQNDIVEYDKQKDNFLTINWGACTIGAFSWIGEELKIEWGEG